jgi:RNA polymerase sigma-70 factor (ECF subfamily)
MGDGQQPRGIDDADRLRLHLTVLRCQAGDESAFARLLAEFGGRTLAYARGLVGDDADDVQQETWLAVYDGIRHLHDPGAFPVWLFRTTRHRALNWLRRFRRERELLDDIPLEQVPDDTPPDDDRPRFDGPEFTTAIAGLPPPQREALLLRYRDDLTYAQIAVVVGCPIGTVRARLHYAKKRLQHLLTTESDDVRTA